jgi:hypothetical protein
VWQQQPPAGSAVLKQRKPAVSDKPESCQRNREYMSTVYSHCSSAICSRHHWRTIAPHTRQGIHHMAAHPQARRSVGTEPCSSAWKHPGVTKHPGVKASRCQIKSIPVSDHISVATEIKASRCQKHPGVRSYFGRKHPGVTKHPGVKSIPVSKASRCQIKASRCQITKHPGVRSYFGRDRNMI